MSEIDCTVVIPVFNRGEALVDGIESLRGQTLGSARIEIIYVDDGSDDGVTPALIDDIVRATPNATVFHEPASGSPGRPRNVGLAHATGEFVFFADHDDWFDRHALELLVGWARRHDSDVVIGKVVAHGRRAAIPRLFRESRARIPGHEAMISLTPHKLFRRTFLEDHRIRAPEGRRRLEDHHFVTHAYLHANVISVYADHVCYHHNHPGDAGNFSRSPLDLEVYTRSNRDVIDLIWRHTEGDPARRDAFLRRPVLHEILKKAGPRRMRPSSPEGEELKHQVLRTALLEAVPDSVIDRLGAFPRATANALRNDEPGAVRRIDARAAALSLRAELVELVADGPRWTISYRIVLERDGAPVTFRGTVDRDPLWLDDGTLARSDADRPERIEDITGLDLEVLLASRRTSVQWHLPTSYTVQLRQTVLTKPFRRRPTDATLTVVGNATLDLTEWGTRQVSRGVSDVVLRAEVLGVDLKTRLDVVDDSALPTLLPEAQLAQPGVRAAAIVTENRRTLAVEVTRTSRS